LAALITTAIRVIERDRLHTIGKLGRDVTVVVGINARAVRRRMRIAGLLFRLAAWILGCALEVEMREARR
jgi:hypothetical protein